MTLPAKEPFHFYTRQTLTYLTGRRASTLGELLSGIKEASEASIYHHTHHFLAQHEFLSPEPPNDFAYWITNILQDRLLGEEVASIDLREYASLEAIRSATVDVIERGQPSAGKRLDRHAPAGEEFHFMEAKSFVFPTRHVARSLEEFRDCLQQVSIFSIYFHVFEARLREGNSDFSLWLSTSLQEEELAKEFLQFDPYTQTLENLRLTLIRLVEARLQKG